MFGEGVSLQPWTEGPATSPVQEGSTVRIIRTLSAAEAKEREQRNIFVFSSFKKSFGGKNVKSSKWRREVRINVPDPCSESSW